MGVFEVFSNCNEGQVEGKVTGEMRVEHVDSHISNKFAFYWCVDTLAMCVMLGIASRVLF